MKCPKCNGRGEHPRKLNCPSHGAYDCYIHGCHETVRCRSCGGIGFVGMDAVRELLIAMKYREAPERMRLIELALKEFDADQKRARAATKEERKLKREHAEMKDALIHYHETESAYMAENSAERYGQYSEAAEHLNAVAKKMAASQTERIEARL